MAWRIAEYVERGEIDSRSKGRVTGTVWLCGRDQPVLLELEGNPWRDLAGQLFRFGNPRPEPLPEHLSSFAAEQNGVVGDMTAARKVKIPDVGKDEFEHYYKAKIPFPWHWGNCLYLEWHSEHNGRVVIESTDFELTPGPELTWRMAEDEEIAQRSANAEAMNRSVERIAEAVAKSQATGEDEDQPQSRAEAEADAEAARMDLLTDRITARLEREGHGGDQFERIMEEERERLRRERGEPEPEPLTPEEEAEREAWLSEMNAAAEEAMAEAAEAPDPLESRMHPLVESCHEFSLDLCKTIQANGWLPDDAPEEHPLKEVRYGLSFASAKLAGALNGHRLDWPPDSLFAGDSLVRLKKARRYLEDCLMGLDAAEEQKLTDPSWLHSTRREVEGLRETVRGLIAEVRAVLARADEEA